MTEFQATKIRQKESVYRRLYSSLLERKKDALKSVSPMVDRSSPDTFDFEDERKLLAQIVRTETANLFFGIATTATIFAVLRFGPRLYIRNQGGEFARNMKQAEKDAQALGTAGVQKRIGKKKFKLSEFHAMSFGACSSIFRHVAYRFLF